MCNVCGRTFIDKFIFRRYILVRNSLVFLRMIYGWFLGTYNFRYLEVLLLFYKVVVEDDRFFLGFFCSEYIYSVNEV